MVNLISISISCLDISSFLKLASIVLIISRSYISLNSCTTFGWVYKVTGKSIFDIIISLYTH